MTEEALVETPQEEQGPVSYSVAVKPPDGYEVADVVVLYKHESASEFPNLDLPAQFRKLNESRLSGAFAIGTTEQRAKKTRQHQATHIWIDTAQSAEKREKTGTRAARPKDDTKLAQKALGLVGKMLRDKEFLAEMRATGEDPKATARDRACAEVGIPVEELRKLLQSYLGA